MDLGALASSSLMLSQIDRRQATSGHQCLENLKFEHHLSLKSEWILCAFSLSGMSPAGHFHFYYHIFGRYIRWENVIEYKTKKKLKICCENLFSISYIHLLEK